MANHVRVRENLVVISPFERLVPKEMDFIEINLREVPKE